MRYRSTEDDIIALLTEAGYSKRTTRLHEVHLHAIERPGWRQIFRFVVSSIDEANGSDRYGIFLGDERSQSSIELFESADDRDDRLRSVSENLIRGERRSRSRLEVVLIGAFLALLITLLIVAAVNPH